MNNAFRSYHHRVISPMSNLPSVTLIVSPQLGSYVVNSNAHDIICALISYLLNSIHPFIKLSLL